MLLFPHIIAGFIALLSGFTAVIAKKGGVVHRQAGLIFVLSMLAMTSLGFSLAVLKPTYISVLTSSLTFYLVATSFLTIKGTVQEHLRWHVGFAIVGTLVGAVGIAYLLKSLESPKGAFEGVPTPVWFIFTAVACAATASDIRMIKQCKMEGISRITRHLWRMEFALAVACLAFFIGQSKFFPELFRHSVLLAAPMLFVLCHMMYWLVKTRISERKRRSDAYPTLHISNTEVEQ